MSKKHWVRVGLLCMHTLAACGGSDDTEESTPKSSEPRAMEAAQGSESDEPKDTPKETETKPEKNSETVMTTMADAKPDKPMADAKPSGASCPTGDALNSDTTLSGDNGGERTLQGTVRVRGSTSLFGGTIKLEPGTVLVFEEGASLTFGSGEEGVQPTKLEAAGEADALIRSCGAKPGAGKWGGLTILKSVTSSKPLQHWLIDGAGAGKQPALTLDAELQVKDLRVTHSAWDGISAAIFGEGSQHVTVDGAEHAAVSLTDVEAIARFPSDSTFTNNKLNVVSLAINSQVMGVAVKLPPLGIPYHQPYSFSIDDGSWTIDAGVEYWLAEGALIEVGKTGKPVKFNVAGTEAKPVLLRGEQEKKGYWNGLQLSPSVDKSSKLSHLSLAHAGSNANYALVVRAAVSIDDLTVRDSQNGVQITTPLSADSARLSVRDSGGYPLTAPVEALTTLPKGGKFTNNEKNVVLVPRRLTGPAVVGTIPNLGIPYRAEEIAFGQPQDDVSIAAGTQFVFTRAGRIDVGSNGAPGKLVALGTEKEPVVFRGEQDAVGSWMGLTFNASASADCKLEYAQVKGAITTVLRPISVKHSKFEKSASYGLIKTKADTNDYKDTNTFTDNAQGDVFNF